MIARIPPPGARLGDLLSLLEGVRKSGSDWIARCPAHPDSTPSLSVALGDNGGVVMHCHAGCSIEKVMAAIGKTVRDLSREDGAPTDIVPERPKAPSPEKFASIEVAANCYASRLGGSVAKVHIYLDRDGSEVGAVVRIQTGTGKTYRPLSRQGDSWVGAAMAKPRPIYRLPELLAADPEEPVLVVEGEVCVEAAIEIGMVATCSAGGARAANASDWTPLKNRFVCVLPDHDASGEQFAADVVRLAHGAGARAVAVVRLPGLSDGDDIVQWIKAGRDAGKDADALRVDLVALLANTPTIHTAAPKCSATAATAVALPPWPQPLNAAVRIGIVGRFLDAVEMQTEADPAAMVADLLVRVGNCVGRGPHFLVSGDRHACNLYVAIVGNTAQGRKGTSAAYPRQLLQLADPTWSSQCQKSGLASGEGIIWSIRDPMEVSTCKKTGDPIMDDGVADKRCMVIETELARTLRAANRRENTLSPIIRQAWEGGRLATMTKTPYAATDPHVSLLAHVTKHEFLKLLNDGDVVGGTINRFLFVASRRQRELPFGGSVDTAVMERLAGDLAKFIEAARQAATEMHLTPDAREAWPAIYHNLGADETAPGVSGQLLGRATAQVRRLAMIFAILDGQQDVGLRHVEAALEVWRYSRETIAYVFGTSTGDRVADRIQAELRGTPDGVDRTDMLKLFGRHVSAAAINEALELLRGLGRATSHPTATGGRPREVWRAV